MVNECRNNDNSLPEFKEMAGAFAITFVKRPPSGGVNGGVNDLLGYIKNHPGMKAITFAKDYKRPKRTIENWLRVLREENKIVFVGSNKTGGYYLNES